MKFVIQFFAVFLFLFSSSTAQASSNLSSLVQKTFDNDNVSITIQSLETGEKIVDYKGHILRKPASNLKLLSGYAVLNLLGADYRFQTEVYTDGELTGNVLKGNIVLKGYGDPTLMYIHLKKIGTALKNKGIRKIDGHILGDDTYFRDNELSPGIQKNEESDYYAARVSSLTLSPNEDFDAGTVIVQVLATNAGQKATIKVTPHMGNMKIINSSKTVSRNSRNTVSIKRNYNTNEIVISGQIPVGKKFKQWVTVNDPTIYTLAVARAAFQDVGIQFSKGSHYWRYKVKPEDKLIYTHQSRTLKAMFPQFMKLSNNTMADTFVKSIGAEFALEGSLQSGIRVIAEYLQANGLNTTSLKMIDGSGLSSANKVTSNELASFLMKASKANNFETFYNSLPVGGEKNRLVGGTLKERFTGLYTNRVYAKTGYIKGVYTLSGYVKTRVGNQYVFSIMTENNTSSKIDEMDRFVKMLIDFY